VLSKQRLNDITRNLKAVGIDMHLASHIVFVVSDLYRNWFLVSDIDCLNLKLHGAKLLAKEVWLLCEAK